MPSNDLSRVYPLRPEPPPMSIFSYSSKDFANPAARTKRRQVKNACTNCQRACKKCDDARPCLRCVKYGIAEECVDSQRKERKKGVKRGPYKKRDGRAAALETTPPVSSDATPTQVPQYLSVAYPPYFPHYPAPDKALETTGMLYAAHPYYIAPLPQEVDYQQQQQGAIYQAGYPAGPNYYVHASRQIAVPYQLYPAPQKQGPHEMLPNSSH